jgi:hypothetical protein
MENTDQARRLSGYPSGKLATVILWVEEIPHQLVTIGNFETLSIIGL